MTETTRAEHKLECAVDLVSDLCKMEREAEEAEQSETANDKEAFKIRPHQVKEFVSAFCMFDRNGDGVLDEKEMASVFRALCQNPTTKDIQEMIHEVDANHDHKVNIDEYVDLLLKHMQTQEEVKDEMRTAFEAFDRNGDGKISREELMKVLQISGEPLTSREADELMEAIDTNKDNVIDMDEFTNFLCAGYPIVEEDGKSVEKK